MQTSRKALNISNLFKEDEDSKLGQERIRVGHRGVGKIVEMEEGRLYCMKENMIDKFIKLPDILKLIVLMHFVMHSKIKKP